MQTGKIKKEKNGKMQKMNKLKDKTKGNIKHEKQQISETDIKNK